jgi:PhzF family phenazine biosynthesis protein
MRYYAVDVFTDKLFSGNPAGVCLPDRPLDDDIMQSIAADNNLPETAFAEKRGDGLYGLRWFTPTTEIDLCGHATLGTASVAGSPRPR